MGIQYKNIDQLQVQKNGIRGSRIEKDDLNIFGSVDEPIDFGENPNDRLEFSVYEPQTNELLYWDVLDKQRVFVISGLEDSQEKKVVLKPAEDLRNAGFEAGEYTINYSFFRDQYGNYKDPRSKVYIQEISQTRTEVRILPLLGESEQRNNDIKDMFFDFAQGKISGDIAFRLIKQSLESFNIDQLQSYFTQENITNTNLLLAGLAQTLNQNKQLINSRILSDIRALIKDSNHIFLTKLQTLTLFYNAASRQVDEVLKKYGSLASENSLKNDDDVQDTQLAGPIVSRTSNLNDPKNMDLSNVNFDPRKFTNDSFRAKASRYLINAYYDYLLDILDEEFSKNVPEDWRILRSLLNFGKNETYLIANWEIDTTTFPDTPAIVAKLYEPLPTTIEEKDVCWITREVSSPLVDKVFLLAPEDQSATTQLRGPNWAADTQRKNKTSGRTEYQTWDEIISTNPASSQNILDAFISASSPGVELNIDHTNYNNFVNFSRASERLKNFKSKLTQIESIEGKIDAFQSSSYSGSTTTQNEIQQLQTKKRVLVNGFDTYENYLYKESGSFYSSSAGTNDIGEWPKSNDVPPFELYSVTSSIAENWYENQLSIAEIYDNNNNNSLVNLIPFHIAENPDNEDWIIFHDMIGQHFDTLWTYVSELEEITSRDQSLSKGLSKDLTYTVAESFGWDLFNGSDTSQLIDNAVGATGSVATGSIRPLTPERRTKEVWRRILNNMPFLLKSRGTGRSVKALLACYGIPSTFFRIREYGGPDPKLGTSKKLQDDFTYGLNFVSESNSYLTTRWDTTQSTYPNTIEYKFQTTTKRHQVVFKSNGGDRFVGWVSHSEGNNGSFVLSIESGSAGAYKNIKTPIQSLFDGNVYSGMVTRTTSGSTANFEVYTKLFDCGDITSEASSSEVISGSGFLSSWADPTLIYFGRSATVDGTLIYAFDGLMDEIRMWRPPLSESRFDNHVTNAEAYDGNESGSFYNDLIFRLSFNRPHNLAITQSIDNVASNIEYAPSASAVNFNNLTEFPHQYEGYTRQIVADVPNIGGNRPSDNKIRLEESSLVFGNLSPYHRAEFSSYDYAPLDSNKIGVYVSSMDVVNNDIINSFGQIDFDNKIGDPADQYNYSYRALKQLNEFYWKKYKIQPTGSIGPDANEYIRYLRLFDKSIFEQILDLLPARANADTGFVIEPHMLERSKVNWKRMEREDLTKDEVLDVFIAEITAEKIIKEVELDRKLNRELFAEKILKEAVVDRKDLRELFAEKILKEAETSATRNIQVVAERLLKEANIDINVDKPTDYLRPVITGSVSQEVKDRIIEQYERGIITQPALPINDWHKKGSYIYAPGGVYSFFEKRRNQLRLSKELSTTRTEYPWTVVSEPVTSSIADTEPFTTASANVTQLGNTTAQGIIEGKFGKENTFIKKPQVNPRFSVYVKAITSDPSSELNIEFNTTVTRSFTITDDQISDLYWTRVDGGVGTGSLDFVRLRGQNVYVQWGQLENGGQINSSTAFQPTRGGQSTQVYQKIKLRDEDGIFWSDAYKENHYKISNTYRESIGQNNLRYNGSKQTVDTTIDGRPPFETTFGTDTELTVADTDREDDAPILDVE